jgi:hypothetical protein
VRDWLKNKASALAARSRPDRSRGGAQCPAIAGNSQATIVPVIWAAMPRRIAATRLMLRRTGAMDWPSDLRQTALA